MAKVDQNSKSCLANILDPNYDDYISNSQHQGPSGPAYQFLSTMHQQQQPDLTNINRSMRVPIHPYPEDVGYSLHEAISVPGFQNHLSDGRHHQRGQKPTEVNQNDISAVPEPHANFRNMEQCSFQSYETHCNRCIPKKAIQKTLEVINQELKATLQEVRVIADKVRDEVF